MAKCERCGERVSKEELLWDNRELVCEKCAEAASNNDNFLDTLVRDDTYRLIPDNDIHG